MISRYCKIKSKTVKHDECEICPDLGCWDKKDGGPAYPEYRDVSSEQNIESTQGMSLRDYFAAKAMAGMFAGSSVGFKLASSIVELSYEIADAMIEQREK